jgi:uncharacterized membrane protein YjjP (DUF1212 family)
MEIGSSVEVRDIIPVVNPKVPTPPFRTSWTGWTPAHGNPLPPALSSADPRVAFVLNLGRALHTSGYSAQRLEEALMLSSDRLGLVGQFFSTPTSIMASFGPQDDQRTFMIRVEPGESDLGKLARVDQVTRDVLMGRLTPAEGNAAIASIESAPPAYGELVTTVAFGVASGSAARFLGGGAWEVMVGLAIGLLIGVLALFAGRHAGIGRVFEPVAAFTASALAALSASLGAPVSVLLATLAGVIILIPGLTLTTAMTELSTRHLASGTARLMGALVLLISITFGIAFGSKAVSLAFGEIPIIEPVGLPPWTLVAALITTPLAFVVLLKAEPRDAPWIVLAGALAFGGARLGSEWLGPELGAFGGALLTGMGSQWYSRITNRPSQIALVPGLLLLVPGSIGLRSLTSMMDRDVLLGVEGVFRMGLIAVSLVSGILIARIVSPRRQLME